MRFLAFFVPIFTFYALLLISLCAGLLAFVGAFFSHQRHRWILIAGLSAVLIGSWVNYHYRAVLWGTIPDITWFTVVGLAPIALGAVSLVSWFLPIV